MNFLQLAQAVMREGGVSGSLVTVSNQRGEAERIVRWVAQSYQEICLEEAMNWNFLRKRVAVQLTPGTGEYLAADLGISDLAQWDVNTMRVALNANLSDETFLSDMRWNEFRDFWLFSTRRDVLSRPLNCSIAPDGIAIAIGPKPDAAYWLNLEYIKQPAELLSDNDIPVIPARFHMLIVWRALRHYGMFESAPEVVGRATDMERELQFRLQMDQTEEVTTGGALC